MSEGVPVPEGAGTVQVPLGVLMTQREWQRDWGDIDQTPDAQVPSRSHRVGFRSRWRRASTGLVVVAFAVVLPWTTGVRGLAPGANEAVTDTPLLLLLLFGVALTGLWVGRQDPWMGAAVVWTALNAWRVQHSTAVLGALTIAAGALAYGHLRALRPAHRTLALRAVVALAALQTLVLVLQAGFALDFVWGGVLLPHGTMGNPAWAGALLAVVLPLAPRGLIPWLAVGVGLARSVLAIMAVAVGLAARIGGRRGILALATLLLVAGFAGWLKPTMLAGQTQSLRDRVGIWQAGWADWHRNSPTAGLGPSGWYYRMPAIQLATGKHPPGEFYAQAHNDVLQWGYEAGVIGWALLAGWLWTHRRAFRWGRKEAGALGAMAVESLGMFGFRIPHVALPWLVILAVATAEEGEGQCSRK